MYKKPNKKRLSIYQVDAFTSQIFRGNPAGVCLLEGELSDEVMLKIAAEMNLSETAFISSESEGPWNAAQEFTIRWFTPAVEVPLCGHATLASAKVLFDEIKVPLKKIVFKSKSGELMAFSHKGGISLDFPLDPPVEIEKPHELISAMNIDEYEDFCYGENTLMFLIRLKDEDAVRQLSPDFSRMVESETSGKIIGAIATAKGNRYDFVSRFFDPWEGINEDPVTGSAHTLLAPYWESRLGKKTFNAYQASSRGGELKVEILPGGRVELFGQAVVVLRGDIFV